MVTPLDRLPRLASIAACATVALALSVVTSATTADTIRVWRVGSPHTGDTPDTTVSFALRQESTRRGVDISVESFPAKGFAATFFDAVTRNTAPDVLVFDNHGLMSGITTSLGSFKGIGEDPALRKDLIRVTGAFDELLGPQRGWTYLFTLSANHQTARSLALRAPECPNRSSGPQLQGELVEVVPNVARAYLQADASSLQTYSDPDRLPAVRFSQEPVSVGVVRPCGVWGNERLAFASINASYEAETTLGHTPALLVLRRPSSRWQLLVATRDPISNGAFVKEVPSLTAPLARNGQTRAVPVPAMLLSPAHVHHPRPSVGQRFGTFTWWSSPSDDVVAEIAEFAYYDDARLFLSPAPRPGSRGQVSAGGLWTTRSTWSWRVWSVSRTGDVAFSDARTFQH